MSDTTPPEWAQQAVREIAATLAALVLPKLPEEHRSAPFQPTIATETRNKIPRLAGIIMGLMPPDPAVAILDEIRRWLKGGASIRATNPTGEVLELQEDGKWHGGITVDGNVTLPPGEIPISQPVTIGGGAIVGSGGAPTEVGSCREAIVRAKELFAASEAVTATSIVTLLANGTPMKFKDVAEALGISPDEVKAIIKAPGSGLKIIQFGWVKLEDTP